MKHSTLALEDGATYFTDAQGQRICTGSQMGRRNEIPEHYGGEPLHLERLPFPDGDCYDAGGAYWGFPNNLWCAWGESGNGERVRVYVRADTAGDAAQAVRVVVRETCATNATATFEIEPPAPLDTFTRAYVVCALWSSTDDDGEPLDKKYTLADIAPETLAQMQADCAKFQSDHGETLADFGGDDEQHGSDFWLTRNRHGSGFWDHQERAEKEARMLTDAAHAFGECDLYVGDDGKLYI